MLNKAFTKLGHDDLDGPELSGHVLHPPPPYLILVGVLELVLMYLSAISKRSASIACA